MDKSINNNGYEYVDLDLPSGTLWATMNVGAADPADDGLYFQWGDTVGYVPSQIGRGYRKKLFDLYDYKWNPSSDEETVTKYNTEDATLDLEDDAAHVNMGGDWHMPSSKQMQELLDNTKSEFYTTLNHISGIKFASKKDGSKSIFIPAAGSAWNGLVCGVGDYGGVWTLDAGRTYIGKDLYFDLYDAAIVDDTRSNGLSIRGVIDKMRDNSKEKKNDMMEKTEKLNLVEILKNAPKGTVLWSSLCGDCILDEIDEKSEFTIRCVAKSDCSNGYSPIYFTSDGQYKNDFSNGECVLFPSQENRNWATFEIPKEHKHFENFQKVLVKEYCEGEYIWVPELYGYYNALPHLHYLVGTSFTIDQEDKIIPYEGNEDKAGTIAE